MAYIHVSPEDYLDEVATETLKGELRRRAEREATRVEQGARTNLTDLFREAWDARDEAAFTRLLLTIKDPDVVRHREAALRAAYAAALRQGTAEAVH